MILYSQKIIQFALEVKAFALSVLAREAHLRVGRDRFYNRSGTTSYPLSIVIYNHKRILGYFDPNFYEMGFHECLMHASRAQLHQVIRHEIAHYLTFIAHGETLHPHGPEFLALCRQLGWDESISAATLCLESDQTAAVHETNRVLRKVEKLLSLARSSNQHEAEAAMIKSQQLLLHNHMESASFEGEPEERVCLKRILKQKKRGAKIDAIAKILETFFVTVVYSRGGGDLYLEVCGTQTHVEIAEYVACVLDVELDLLWGQTQLRGTVAKNSFFLGLARGYLMKIQALERNYPEAATQALMVMEKQLEGIKAMVYPRLTKSTSRAGYCSTSAALGERMGRQLTLNPALRGASGGGGTPHQLQHQ